MIPLYEDQCHVPGFLKSCTMIWSDDVSREKKSGVWDYYAGISNEFNLPLVDHTNIPLSGVMLIGMCHLIEDIFDKLPRNGSYIVIHRTNDRPFTNAMYARKPVSVKHIYTVDCQVNSPNVTAIPFGLASINGEDEVVKMVAKENFIYEAYCPRCGGSYERLNISSLDELIVFDQDSYICERCDGYMYVREIEPPKTKLFVRYNVNSDTPHRNKSLAILKQKPFAKVIETQIPQDEFYREVKAHKFTMALAGCGADASRQWAAIILGSIPIVTDCVEMRHFADLPLVYCPKDMNDITEGWLEAQSVEGKSTERMRMSYWRQHIEEKRKEI